MFRATLAISGHEEETMSNGNGQSSAPSASRCYAVFNYGGGRQSLAIVVLIMRDDTTTGPNHHGGYGA